VLLEGRLTERNPAKALKLVERACSAGVSQACARLANVYAKGDGVAPDPERAVEWKHKACAAGDAPSCP
jgi:TPR repeat protein